MSRRAKKPSPRSPNRRSPRRNAPRRQVSRWRSWGKRAGFVIVLMLLGAGWWFEHSGRLDDIAMDMRARYEREWYDTSEALGLVVNQVYLEGRERMPQQEALLTIGVVEGDPILGIDVKQIKERLEATRWVEHAEVQRSLPDTLHVRLFERRPMALWQHQGQLRLIDMDGKVIEGEEVGSYSYLPIVVGEKAPRHSYQLVKMLSKEPELFAQVSSAIYVGNRRWNIRFYDGKEILLPERKAEQAWRKLVMLDEEKALLRRDVKRIDMRYGERVYLQLTPAALQRERLAEKEI